MFCNTFYFSSNGRFWLMAFQRLLHPKSCHHPGRFQGPYRSPTKALASHFLSLLISNHLSLFANYLHNHTMGCIISKCFTSEITKMRYPDPSFFFLHNFYISTFNSFLLFLPTPFTCFFIQCRTYCSLL